MMAMFRSTCSFLALALLGQCVLAHPQVTPAPALVPIKSIHSCFSYTTTVPYTGKVYCPLEPTSCPPHPECIRLIESTVVVPCPDSRCPKTPTVTVTAPPACKTCQTGCATETIIETATLACPLETLTLS